MPAALGDTLVASRASPCAPSSRTPGAPSVLPPGAARSAWCCGPDPKARPRPPGGPRRPERRGRRPSSSCLGRIPHSCPPCSFRRSDPHRAGRRDPRRFRFHGAYPPAAIPGSGDRGRADRTSRSPGSLRRCSSCRSAPRAGSSPSAGPARTRAGPPPVRAGREARLKYHPGPTIRESRKSTTLRSRRRGRPGLMRSRVTPASIMACKARCAWAWFSKRAVMMRGIGRPLG